MAFSAGGGGNKAFSPFTITTGAIGTQQQQPAGAPSFPFGGGGTAAPGFNFGVGTAAPSASAPQLAFTAATPAASTSSLFSFGTQATPISSTAPGTTSVGQTVGFGAPSATPAAVPTGLTGNFGANNPPNISFGNTAAAATLGTPQTTANAPILFTSVPPSTATNTVQPTFGVPAVTQASANVGAVATTTPAATTSFSFGTGPASLSTTNPVKPTTTTTAVSTTAAASAPATTVSTTQSSTSSVSQMNFRQLQEAINKWMLDLQEQEKIFLEQATKVNAWDRTLIANGDKIAKLNESITKVKNDHTRLEHALDYLKTQQQEFEGFLEPLEAGLPVNIPVEPEREQLYSLTESVDTQLQQMAEDLKEVIRHINEANKTVDKNDPISQILRILNEHTDALQWVEDNANQVRKSLEDVSKQHQVTKKEHERSLRQMFK